MNSAADMVYNERNHLIGSFTDLGDRIIAKNPLGDICGVYYKSSELTWDIYARLVGEGNRLQECLVAHPFKEQKRSRQYSRQYSTIPYGDATGGIRSRPY